MVCASRHVNIVYVGVCYIYVRAYIHLRFKNAALDTHLSGLSVWDNEVVIFVSCMMTGPDGPDGAVVMSSANGLVGTGFASRYRLQPRVGF